MTGPTAGPGATATTAGPTTPSRIEVWAPSGIGEIVEGADLAEVVRRAVPDLSDGDVVLVTSKVVSKAEGRVVEGTRDDVLDGETVRVVATRGRTAIVQNHQGLVQAAAGIDGSNVAAGHVVLLPRDPDASARALRDALGRTHAESWGEHGPNVAVLVTDTAGRAWRHGQTDLAIGAAGMLPYDDHAGRVDAYGNPLAVTAPALADELAGAADLVEGKLTGRPVAVVRGLGVLVLPHGEHGPGARALVRPLAGDMFALGTREAVVAALAGEDAEAFGAPAAVEDLVAALTRVGCVVASYDLEVVHLAPGPAVPAALLHAFGWTTDGSRLSPTVVPPASG